MKCAIAVLLALGGCGRHNFDERVDAAPPGHDEDGDGIPDAIDPCPHIAGDMTDTDGDGVGDACDPDPTLAIDHWLRFSTMQAGDTAFDDIAGFTQEADALRITSNATPGMTIDVGKARIELGWVINGVNGTGQHQIAFGADSQSGGTYYFVELDDNANVAVRDAGIVSYDTTNGYLFLDPMDCGMLHTGVGVTRLDVGATHAFSEGWPGQLYTGTVSTPAYTPGTLLRFAFNGLDVSVRYLAIIVTD